MNSQLKTTINLESLLSLSARLNETNDEHTILNLTILTLMGKLKLFRGIVLTPDVNKEYFTPIIFKGKKQIDLIRTFKVEKICMTREKKEQMSELSEAGYEICIPIIYRTELLALICLSKKLDSKKLTNEEFYYATLVSTITAVALNNANNFRLLKNEKNIVESRNQLLTTLFEVSNDFNALLSKERIISTLSFNLLGQLMISRYAMLYIEEIDIDNSNDRNSKKSNTNLKVIKNTFKNVFSENLIDELLTIKQICFVKDLTVSNELFSWFADNSVVVISPMTIQEETKGYLLIGQKTGGMEFTDENMLFIKVIGNTTVLALENIWLIQMEVERQKLENELSIALEIQNNLLPKNFPVIDGFDFFGISIPSKQVGGDYFDLINLENGNLLIAIADVSGKGIPAALLMANVQAALRVLAPLSLPLEQLLNRLNNIVFQNTAADRFVTFFCGELDIITKKFKFINAGHNPPVYLKADGEIELLSNGGLILGVLDNEINYQFGELTLSDSELIFLYTDGVTETMNIEKEEFGEQKLLETIKANINQNSEGIINAVLKSIKDHRKNQAQYDDITLITIKVQK